MRQKIIFVIICIFCLSAVLAPPVFSEAAEGFIYDGGGKRDPFIPLITQNAKVATGLEAVQSIEDVVLEGIVWDSGGDSIAIMNGIIVKRNEEYGSVKIKAIEEEYVELFINKTEHRLNLNKEGDE